MLPRMSSLAQFRIRSLNRDYMECSRPGRGGIIAVETDSW